LSGDTRPPRASWRKRAGWLVLIWAASVAVMGAVALVLKGAMQMAGLTS
jgi:hypothetical protein